MYDVDGTHPRDTGRAGVEHPQGSARARARIPPTSSAGSSSPTWARPTEKPVFPRYDTFDLPGFTLMPAGKFALPCNWLQIKDNSMDPVHTSFLHAISSGYQFTEAFGALAELDWEETPYGMMYIATRRDRRSGLGARGRLHGSQRPSVHPRARGRHEGKGVEPARGDPLGRAHRRHAHLEHGAGAGGPGVGAHAGTDRQPRLRPVRRPAVRGATAAPADYDAQASQREIAVHALEHLASTDRGVIMLRKIVRDGIRAVAAGRDPELPPRAPAAPIATACQDTVLRIPAEADPPRMRACSARPDARSRSAAPPEDAASRTPSPLPSPLGGEGISAARAAPPPGRPLLGG